MAYKSAKDHIGEAYDQMVSEVRKGRILVGTEAAGRGLDGVISSPFSRVPKQNPDRTVSADGRFCHDCRDPVNTFSSKDDHPSVILPTHSQVMRQAMRLKAR